MSTLETNVIARDIKNLLQAPWIIWAARTQWVKALWPKEKGTGPKTDPLLASWPLGLLASWPLGLLA
jgi:hypothetical protein